MSDLSKLYQHSDIQMTTIWGNEIPDVCSNIESEVHAIRNTVAISDVSHASLLRFSGDNVHKLLNRLSLRDLNLRNYKLQQALFILNGKWKYAEGYIVKEPESYLLILKGAAPDTFLKWIKRHIQINEDIKIELLNQSHYQIALNGPFAWELLSELVDPEIISLPYLSFYYPSDDNLIIRCGETGEFGYLLIYPNEPACCIWEEAMKAGALYNVQMAGLAALDYCALENNFFNIRKEGSINANPKELQLQWRTSYRKYFIHSDALERIRKEPLQQRLTAVISDSILVENEKVYHKGEEIGFIVNAAPYLSGKGYIGLAMIQRPFAESGISGYQTNAGKVRTASPPFVNNRSLVVNPQIHSYFEKDEIQFPVLNAIESS